MLGVFGILAGGGGWVAVDVGSARTTAQPPAAEAGPPVDLVAWRVRAEAALAEVDRQLAVARQAEVEWTRYPGSQLSGTPPRQVLALARRTSELEWQRLLLRSELSAFESMRAVGDELGTAEQQLASLERAIAQEAKKQGPTGPEPQTLGQLRGQRDLQQARRDAKALELEALRSGVVSVARSALPDTADRTTPLAAAVSGLARGERPTDPSPTGRPDTRAPALAQRDPADGEAQEVYNGAPPNPGPGLDGTPAPDTARGSGQPQARPAQLMAQQSELRQEPVPRPAPKVAQPEPATRPLPRTVQPAPSTTTTSSDSDGDTQPREERTSGNGTDIRQTMARADRSSGGSGGEVEQVVTTGNGTEIRQTANGGELRQSVGSRDDDDDDDDGNSSDRVRQVSAAGDVSQTIQSTNARVKELTAH